MLTIIVSIVFTSTDLKWKARSHHVQVTLVMTTRSSELFMGVNNTTSDAGSECTHNSSAEYAHTRPPNTPQCKLTHHTNIHSMYMCTKYLVHKTQITYTCMII